MKTIGFAAPENVEKKADERVDVKDMEKRTEKVIADIDRTTKWVAVGLSCIGVTLLFMCGMIAGMHVAVSEFNDAGIEYTKMSGPNGDEEHYFIRTGWQVTPITEFGTNRIFRITKNK